VQFTSLLETDPLLPVP